LLPAGSTSEPGLPGRLARPQADENRAEFGFGADEIAALRQRAVLWAQKPLLVPRRRTSGWYTSH
jgi:hypothetical protein